MQISSFLLFLCITGFQISHEYALDGKTKQSALDETIVQLIRSSLLSDDKRESVTCPEGMEYDEDKEQCKCFSEDSTYNPDKKKCQCNDGFKELTSMDNRIFCYKRYDDAFGLPGLDGLVTKDKRHS
ncbi:uncharacterized protein LOC143062413 [Mytilus galloprovincialis]|uniref:uncharacterized protein LOC143062413 n=1 Tax=Mytilus galloprovincialis TaxID=29158 RepID=UPI003F7CC534